MYGIPSSRQVEAIAPGTSHAARWIDSRECFSTQSFRKDSDRHSFSPSSVTKTDSSTDGESANECRSVARKIAISASMMLAGVPADSLNKGMIATVPPQQMGCVGTSSQAHVRTPGQQLGMGVGRTCEARPVGRHDDITPCNCARETHRFDRSQATLGRAQDEWASLLPGMHLAGAHGVRTNRFFMLATVITIGASWPSQAHMQCIASFMTSRVITSTKNVSRIKQRFRVVIPKAAIARTTTRSDEIQALRSRHSRDFGSKARVAAPRTSLNRRSAQRQMMNHGEAALRQPVTPTCPIGSLAGDDRQVHARGLRNTVRALRAGSPRPALRKRRRLLPPRRGSVQRTAPRPRTELSQVFAS